MPVFLRARWVQFADPVRWPDALISFYSTLAEKSLPPSRWLDLLPDGVTPREQEDEVKRGTRRAVVRHDWKTGRQPYVRLLRIHGLSHAWSGGAAGQAFSDPTGPDALRLAWQFFAANMKQAAPAR